MTMLVGGKPAIGTIEYDRAKRGNIDVRTDEDGPGIVKEEEVYAAPEGPRTSAVPGRDVIEDTPSEDIDEVLAALGSDEEPDAGTDLESFTQADQAALNTEL